MSKALALTCSDLAKALTPKPSLLPQTKPHLLHDMLAMKRARGDADCDAFKQVARFYGSGLNATISGAAWAMRSWLKKGAVPDTAERRAFLADLDRVLAGDLTGWDIPAEVA